MSSLKNYFVNLNIFQSSDDLTTDEEKEHERRSNIISTRIFFIVFIFVLIELAIIMKTRNQNTLITVENPSEDQFKHLPSDAHCPCSHISLSYGEFISIQTRFHQICSSDFISDRWIKTINFGLNTTYFSAYDFRTEGSAIFQSLESFCRLSKGYAIQSIDSFNKDLFISQEVLKESVFQSQINAIIQHFELSSPIEFSTQIALIRKMIAGNRFLSALQTNYMQWYMPWQNNVILIVVHNRVFLDVQDSSSCSCRIHIDCNIELMMFNQFRQSDVEYLPPDDKILMKIPGMSHSCLPVNTILLSTLECFYNQTCLNNLVSLLLTTANFTVISELEQSRYKLNSTIQIIIDNLMIEESMTDISYKKYYEQCAPISCTYFKNDNFIIQKIVKFVRRRPSQNAESISCYAIQSIDSFNKDLFISQEVLKESVFQSQINAIIQQFELSSPIEFSTQVVLIRKMIAGNRFLSALQTNYMQWYMLWQNNVTLIVIHNRLFLDPQASSSCSCRVHIDCNMELMIFNQFGQSGIEYFPPDDKILMKIPGMSHSCLPVNTILLSSLECFYNQTCLNNLVSLLPTTVNFTVISELEQSRYKLNSTIQTIIDNLMIEEWVTDISYKKYYEQCAPISCTYFKNDKYDWKFVLTQLIGLLASIITVCSFIIQKIVKFVRRRPSQNTESISCKFSCLIY
ncbi:unnamed protein product [Rotaria sp. Silwood1]|nr:unnamed protein product [Rotaria sp. Silwood1]